MRNCVDEGTLQAWFDGELTADAAANVATHLHACAQCAENARAVEAENLLLSEGLAAEFTAAVPTERLRQRVDLAVAGLQRASGPVVRESRWSAFAEFFSFRPLAYATVAAAILLAAIVGFIYLKNQKPAAPQLVQNNAPVVTPAVPSESPAPIATPVPSRSPELVAVKKQKSARRPVEADGRSIAWQERQYENAIARLSDALKTQPPMRPALQVDYEYNMAVIDSAIATTRDAAKKNPKDPLANQFMLAAYQSKVDFMNQVADARVLDK